MSLFTMFCKLITVIVNRSSAVTNKLNAGKNMDVVPVKPARLSVQPSGFLFKPVRLHAKLFSRLLPQVIFALRTGNPLRIMGLLHGRWSASETRVEDYGINQPTHLSPVANMQPAYIQSSTCTPQTNRMKQVLHAAKSSTLGFFVLLMSVFAAQESIAQTTLVNYNFNSGASFAALAPTLATNITSSATGSATFATGTGTATGANTFVANTAGNALQTGLSSTWTFTLGGSALPSYQSLRIYFQAGRFSSNDNTIAVTYSVNGGAFVNTSITTSVGANPLSLNNNGSWFEGLLNLPPAADNATSLAIRFTTGAGGSNTIRLDNFQVQGLIPVPYYVRTGGTFNQNLQNTASWTSSPTGTGGTSPANFTNAGQTFYVGYNGITTNTITAANWNVSGVGSKLVIGDGVNPTEFILPDNTVAATYFSGTAAIDVMSNGTFTLKDGQYPTFGTLSANSTINYNRTTGTTTQAIAAITYGNVIVSAGSGYGTSLDGDIVLNGNLTINTPGGTFALNNNDIAIKGNWINTAGTFTPGTGLVTFNGTTNQTISGNATTFSGLTINNSAGVTQDNATATTTVTGTLTLTSGVFTNTGTNVLVANGTVNRTSGYVNGRLRKPVTTGSNVARTFEIGDAASYTPVTVSFASVTTAGTLTANSTSGDHPSINSSGISGSAGVNRYWTLTNATTVFNNYSATFTFVNPGDLDGGVNTNNFIVKRFASAVWNSTTIGTKTPATTQATGITGFGDFAIGEACTPPPISLQPSASSQSICQNGTFTNLSINASAGSGTITKYEWYSNPSPSTTGGTLVFTDNSSSTVSNYTPVSSAIGTLYYYCIIYNSTGCINTSNISGAIIVNAPPSLSNAGSNATICSNRPYVLSANSPAVGTGLWSISGPDNSMTQILNASSPTATFTPSMAGSYTLTWTISNSTCTAQTSSVVITVNQTPAAPTFLAAPTATVYCNGGTVDPITFNTIAGQNISWTSSVDIGFGTSGPGNIGGFTAVNNDIVDPIDAVTSTIHVISTDAVTGCISDQLTFTITVNPSPASLSDVTNKIYCNGTSVNIAFTGAITNYNWSTSGDDIGYSLSSPNPSVNNILAFNAVNNGTTPLVATFIITPNYTSGSVSCTSGTPKSFTITVNPSPTTSNAGTTQTICATGTATLAANAPVVGTGAWSVSGPSTLLSQFSSITDPAAIFTPAGGPGNYILTWTISNSPCAVSASTVTITVNELLNKTVTAAASSVCSGTGTNIVVASSALGVSYQLRDNADNSLIGSPVIGTGGNINLPTGALTADKTFNVLASVAVCGNLQMTATPTVTVTPAAPVSVVISSNAPLNKICAGSSITFSAVVTNGGTPTYQWKVGTTNVGTASTYTTTTLTNGQVVTCVVTSTAPCATGSPATSNAITVTVNPLPQNAGSNGGFNDLDGICAGSPQSLTITTTSGTGPFTITYTGSSGPSPITQSGITSGVPFNSTFGYTVDNTTLTLTSLIDANGCERTTGFGDGTTQLNPVTGPNVSSFSLSNSTTACQGGTSSVTVSSTSLNTNTGYTVTYTVSGDATLYTATFTTNNGNPTRTGSFTTVALTSTPTTTITVTAIRLTSASCNTAITTGNTRDINVNPSVPVSVSIVSNDADNIICAGQSVTFTATPTNGGTTPAYQWKVNGTNSGTGATFTTTTLTNNAIVTCVLTSNATCPGGNPATSNGITTTVNPLPTGLLTATENSGTANNNIICGGSNVTFTATAGYANYEFKVGATTVQSGALNTYSSSTLANNDAVSVVVTSASGCTATFGPVTITVTAVPTISLFTASPSAVCLNTPTVTNPSVLSATATGGNNTLSFTGTNTTALDLAFANNTTVSYPYSSIHLTAPVGVAVNASSVIKVVLNITHPRIQELDIYLVDPTGTRAMLLTSDNGGPDITLPNAANYTNVTLKTDASTSIAWNGSSPTALQMANGTFLPEGSISSLTQAEMNGAAGGTYNAVLGQPASAPFNPLLGAAIDGNWTLRVFDDAAFANGASSINSWSLEVTSTGQYTTTINDVTGGGNTQLAIGSTASVLTTTVNTAGTPLVAGQHSYTATVTDLAGCSYTTPTPTVLTVNARPTAALTGTTAICSGSASLTVNLTGTGPWNFSVNGTPYTATSSPYIFPVSPTTTTSYVLTDLTDASGCTVVAGDMTSNATVTVNQAPVLTASNISNVPNDLGICGATVTLGSNVTASGLPTPSLEYRIGGPTGTIITSPYLFPSGTTEVTVIATNSCGTDSKTFNVTVTDTQAPVVTTVAGALDATLECSDAAGIAAALAAAPEATDNCSAVTIHLVSDVTTPNATGYVQVRTWNFTDVATNTSLSFVQTITIADNTAPVVTTVAGALDATLECSDAAGIAAALAAAPEATDNCSAVTIHLVSDVTTPNATGYVQVRTWNFTDVATNTSLSFVQTITIADNTAPVVTTVAGALDATLECSDAAGIAAALAAAPEATDNCSAVTIHLVSDVTTPNATGYVQVRTWNFTDVATNTSLSFVQTITIADNTAPVVTTVAGALDATLECSDAAGIAAALAAAPEATDNCSAVTIHLVSDVTTPNATGYVQVRTWNFTDVATNTSLSFVQTITIADNTAPVVTTVAGALDATLECSDAAGIAAALAAAPEATDNCSAVTIHLVSDVTTPNATGYVQVRTWNFTDVATNTSLSFVQTITIADNTAPVVTTVAGALDATLECSDAAGIAAALAAAPEATDNCSAVTIHLVSDVTTPNATGYVQVRTWNFTDVATNTSLSFVQTITIADNTAPVVTTVAGALDATLECSDAAGIAAALAAAPEATDNCSAVTIHLVSDVTTPNATGYVQVRTWNFTDVATNTSLSFVQTITIADNTAPVVTTVAGALDATLECSDAAGIAAALAAAPEATDNCSAVTIHLVSDVTTPNATGYVQVRTWNFTDVATNTSLSFVQTITIADNTAPVVTTVAGALDATLECSDAAGIAAALAAAPEATDNCSAVTIHLVSDVTTPNATGYVQVRTWNFTDVATNTSLSFVQTITIADNTAPVVTTVAGALDATLECSDAAGIAAALAAAPEATDNCSAVTIHLVSDVTTPNATGYVQVRTWNFTDVATNTSLSFVQTITIADNTAPVVTTVAGALDATLECSDAAGIAAALAAAPEATDNCSAVTIHLVSDVTTPNATGYVQVRTWNFTDVATNTSLSFVQTITIADNTAPVVTTVAGALDATLECSDAAGIAAALAAAPEATDNCSAVTIHLVSDVTTPNATGYVQVRTWNFTDVATNTSLSFVQTITIADNTAPVVTTVAGALDATLECSDAAGIAAALAAAPEATDNCSAVTIHLVSDVTTPNATGYVQVRTWNFTDVATNTSLSFVQTITIADNTAPVVTTVAGALDATLECSDAAGIAAALAAAPEATDNCSAVTIHLVSDVTTPNATGYVQVRTWNFTDVATNTSLSFVQTITIADNTAPVVTTVAGALDATLECSDAAGIAAALAAAPEATDNCSAVTIHLVSDVTTPNATGYVQVRTWNFTDVATNTSLSFVQTITIADNTAPVVTTVAGALDATLECSDAAGIAAALAAAPEATDNCSAVTIHLVSDVTTPNATGYVQVRTWNFTDVATNTSLSFVQTITIADNTAPVVTTVAGALDATLECSDAAGIAAALAAAPEATDNCSAVTIHLVSDVTTPNATGYVQVRTWNFTDVATNTSLSFVQTITIADNTAPVVTTVAGALDATLECSDAAGIAAALAAAPEATDNCSAVTIHLVSDVTTPNATGYVQVRTWNFTDVATNTSLSFVQTITIADTQKPIIVAPSAVSVNSDLGSCSATNVILGSPSVADNCTTTEDLIITNNAPAVFPSGPTTVTWTVTDAAGNSETATQLVTVSTPAITATLTPGTIICNGGTTTLTVSAGGGSGSYTYALDGGTPQTSNSFTVGAGSHDVVIADENGCTLSITKNIVVGQPAAVSGIISGTTAICAGSSATLTINVVGVGTINGILSDGTVFSGIAPVITVPVSPSSLTTYTIASMTDANCTALAGNLTGSATITVNPLPTVTAGAYGPLCNNAGTIALSGLPAGGIWTGTGISGNNFNPAGLAGDYSLTYSYTDANGCSNSDITTIHVNTAPSVSITGLAAVYCQNAVAVTLTGLPAGGTFKIDGIPATSFNPASLSAGSHTVLYTYTDEATCSATATQSVSITALPTATISYTNSGYCATGTTSVTRTGQTGGTYSALPIGLSINGTTGQIDLANSQAGDYTVTYTFSNNGCSNTTTTDVSIYAVATALESLGDKNVFTNTNNCSATVTLNPPVGNSAQCHVAATGYRLDINGNLTSTSLSAPFPIGTTVVRWIANVNGQQLSVDQNVIVTDNVAPVPTVTTLSTITGQCSAAVLQAPTATDNCAGLITGTPDAPLSYNVPGTYTINWTYDDGHGNTFIQSQTLVVAGLQQIAISSTGTACAGGITIGLPASQSGVNYQLIRNSGSGNVNVGAPLPGSNGDALEFGTFTTPGTYTVRATSVSQGCTSIMPGSVVVTSGVLPTAYTLSSAGSVCTGDLSIILSGSQSGVTYKLVRTNNNLTFLAGTQTGNGFALEFTPVTAVGTYTIIATSASGCDNNMTGSIVVNSSVLPTVFNVTTSGSACAGGVSVGLDGSENGVTYQLKNGSTNIGGPVPGTGSPISFSLQAAGNYTVVATRTGGCSANMSGTAVVNSGTLPTSFTITGGGAYCSGPGFAIGLTGSQSGVNYQLYRDGIIVPGALLGGTNSTLNFGTFNVLGSYTVVATNTATNCTNNMIGSASITAGALPQAEIVNITGTTILNCTVSSVSVQATGGASYSWNGGAATASATNTFTSAGVYTVTVTSASGCTSTASITITQDIATPTAGITNNTGITELTCNATSISVTATGGVSYSWSNGLGNNATATITSAGTYTVTVKGANGCTSTASIVVTQNTAVPTAGIINNSGATALNCNIASISVTATGGVSYSWSNGLGNDASATIVSAGTYTVTVTGASGCTSTASIVVTQDIAVPTAGITNNTGTTALTCNTTSINVTATGGVSYSWSNGLGNNAAATITAPGTYTVTVTGASGCTSIASIVVTQDIAVPTAGITNNTGITELTCNATSISVTATGGVSYSWSNGLGNNAAATIIAPGTYTVTVTGASGCTSTASIVVTQNTTAPTAAITNNTATTILTCSTTSISVTATGGLSYSWSNGLGNNAAATITAPGTYTVTVTGAGGCVSTAQIVVTQNTTAPTAAITNNSATTVLTCNTTSIGVTATGGVSYSWSNGLGNNATATIISAGTYTVTVTGANGCTSTASITVTQASGISALLISQTNVSCNGLSDGSVQVVASGGTGNFTYSLDGGASSLGGTFSGLSAGSHSVVATDIINGCVAAPVSITITQPAVIGISIASQINVLCNGASNGSFVVSASGGTAPYTYSKDGGFSYQGVNAFINLAANTYIVLVKDSKGCTQSAVVTITQPSAIGGSVIANNGSSCGLSDGSATIGGNGGTSPYRFNLDGSGFGSAAGSQQFTGLASGNHTLTIQDANGCETTINFTTASSTLPVTFNVTGGGYYCIGGAGMPIGLSNSQTGVNYQLYKGASSMGSPVAGTGSAISFGNQTTDGTYTVVATATGGCTVSMTGNATVTGGAAPIAYTLTGGGSYCTGAGIAIGLTSSQSGVNYQLYRGASAVGSPVAGNGSAINFAAQTVVGTYTVIATNAATCTTAMNNSVAITTGVLPTLYSVTGGGSYCSGAGLPIGLSSSENGVSYQLKRGATNVGSTVAGNGSAISFPAQTLVGTYTVVATGAGGCTRTMTGNAVISSGTLPTLYTVSGGGTYCSGAGLVINLSGSQAGVNYQLRIGATNIGSAVAGNGSAINFPAQTAAATYTVIATGAGGCSRMMTASAIITAGTLPNVYTVTGGGAYCDGGAGLAVGLNNSQNGVSYQLYRGASTVGSAVAGNGSTINFGIQTIAGTYTVVATSASGCSANMTGSASITVNAAPLVYALTGGGSYCTGAGLPVGLSGSQSGVNYQLYRGASAIGSAVAGNGSAINFPAQTVTGTYTVIATATAGGCTTNMSGNAVITTGTLPTLFTVSGGGAYCSGAGLVVSLSGSNGGVNYQLKRGTTNVGSAVPGNGAAINFAAQTMTGTYTVVATNAAGGCTRTMTGSAIISAGTLPTAYTVSGGGSYCSGAGLVINLSASQSGVSYQLRRSNANVGNAVNGNGAAINFPAQTTTGTYTVIATNAGGCTRTMNGNAIITAGSSPSITVQPASQSGCSGNVTFSVTASNAISYQWQRNNVNIPGATSSSYAAAATQANNGAQYRVRITNGCGTTTSNQATLTVATAVGGLVRINGATSTNACFNTDVTISLSGETGNVTRWEYSTSAGSWQTINVTTKTIVRRITQNTAFRAIVAISAGCTPATSAVASVAVTTTGIGGTVTTSIGTVCLNSNVTYTLTGNTGSVVRWEYSLNGGASWTNAGNAGNTTLTYNNATQNRRYRAVVQRCTGNGTVNSTSAAITLINCALNRTMPATTEVVVTKDEPVINNLAAKLEVTAYPNPSVAYFNLNVKSAATTDVEIKVFDITGKQVAQLKGASYETYRFGNTFVAGTYIIEVRQGNERVTTKVIKQ